MTSHLRAVITNFFCIHREIPVFETEKSKIAEGVTEELKCTRQMEWVRRCNNIHNRAEEIGLHDDQEVWVITVAVAGAQGDRVALQALVQRAHRLVQLLHAGKVGDVRPQIGRASCRERV